MLPSFFMVSATVSGFLLAAVTSIENIKCFSCAIQMSLKFKRNKYMGFL